MNPDYLNNLLAELYPRPSLDLTPRLAYLSWLYGFQAVQALPPVACILLGVWQPAPTNPCRMCGAWHGHHEGCPMPRRRP